MGFVPREEEVDAAEREGRKKIMLQQVFAQESEAFRHAGGLLILARNRGRALKEEQCRKLGWIPFHSQFNARIMALG